MDREEQHTNNVIRQEMAELIEHEPATFWRDVLIVLNEDTNEPICLTQEHVRMLRSHLVQRERMLKQSYERDDYLSDRADTLENNVIPQIRKLLEEVSGRDWMECEY